MNLTGQIPKVKISSQGTKSTLVQIPLPSRNKNSSKALAYSKF